MAVISTAADARTAEERGATILQLRMPGATIRAVEDEATRLMHLAHVPVVISRRVDVALTAGAAGVNLPEDDLPVAAARSLLGEEALIGRSAHSIDVAVRAADEGADFVILGPILETPSHPGAHPLGMTILEEARRRLPIPVIAIGGMRSGLAGDFASIREFTA